jgi:hypothetical protein
MQQLCGLWMQGLPAVRTITMWWITACCASLVRNRKTVRGADKHAIESKLSSIVRKV